jgi:hypothetical protein
LRTREDSHNGVSAISGKEAKEIETITATDNAVQPELSLTRPGVTSYVWRFGYGDILIEVFADGRVFVNAQEVVKQQKAEVGDGCL